MFRNVMRSPQCTSTTGLLGEHWNRTYAQHLNHWGTAEGVNPLGPLEIL